MVSKKDWDADENNKQNNLGSYLDSLSRHQKQMIKGIISKHVSKYLSLEEEDFRTQLNDSLTLNELSKLSKEEKQFRDKLIREIMTVWRRHKEELKEGEKEDEQHREYYAEQAAKGWMPKHHESIPESEITKRTLSVSEAARRHKGKGISVIGAISGVQPLRKMVKGIQVQCLKCNTVYERKYDKPEFFESYVPMERIRKCPICKTSDYLGRTKREEINAVIVELKDHDTFSEIDPLRIIVFGDDEPGYDNTIGIERHVGETIIVTGDLYTVEIGKKRDSRVVAHLYVTHLIKYLAKQDVELTAEDVKAIKRFVSRVGQNEIVGRLAEMFATSVIGYNHVKKGLLLVAASTTLDKTMKKIHAMLVGDPGLAKSLMLKESVRLVPNSTFESVQFATGKSLTAIVTNDEGDAHILRTGPIPQAKGAIASLNEMNRMMEVDQGLILDTMQEQEFTTAKFGLRFHVDAQTAIIGSANPMGGAWKDGKIDLDKIAMIKPLLDRFDLLFTFKDNRDEAYNKEYARQKAEMENRPWPDYTVYLVKHIMYAKQRYPKPRFSEEATAMLNQYYDVRKKFGSPRIRETIFRIAQNLARLKLKDVVDAADAKETQEFYNFILLELEMVVVAVSHNRREEAFEECVTILSETIFPITFEELVRRACERNTQVDNYIGGSFKLEYNKRLRPVLDMLRNHSRIVEVRMNPIVLQYIHQDEYQSDPSDQSDHTFDTLAEKLDEKNVSEENELQKKIFRTFDEGPGRRSDRSDRSDSNEMSPQEKASKRMEYEKLSARALKKSKAASHVGTGDKR
jgi:DNA replicative helicase MCM subunit Mcm2 (Cdc46/Mcm family)